MKRLFFTVVVALSAIACFAGEPQGGIFKHVGLGVSGGTNGISVELSSPVTPLGSSTCRPFIHA